MTPETIGCIENRLREQHSPEQIAERMKFDPAFHDPAATHERIYGSSGLCNFKPAYNFWDDNKKLLGLFKAAW